MAKGTLKDAVITGRSWWLGFADRLVREIKEATAKGLGSSGQFRKYSKEYAEAKGSGSFKRQASTSTTPDLRLTGDMMRDLKAIQADDTSATVGWASFGERVQRNADAGRAIFDDTDGFAKPVNEWIIAELEREHDKRLDATSEHVTITLGRR